MLLRHISPGSTDWMDAMDEGAGGEGGRSWGRRSGPSYSASAKSHGDSERQSESRQSGSGAPSGASGRYFATASPSR